MSVFDTVAITWPSSLARNTVTGSVVIVETVPVYVHALHNRQRLFHMLLRRDVINTRGQRRHDLAFAIDDEGCARYEVVADGLTEHSKDIVVPDLNDPQLLLKGAGQYAAMCTQCHLRPGVENSEQRIGMYSLPPDLSKVHIAPKVAFWAIKHGIKMSAMPASGMAGHDDPTIWSMVAFIEKLPGMTPAQYKAIVAKAPPDEDMDGGGASGHSHDHGQGVPKDSGQSHAQPDDHQRQVRKFPQP